VRVRSLATETGAGSAQNSGVIGESPAGGAAAGSVVSPIAGATIFRAGDAADAPATSSSCRCEWVRLQPGWIDRNDTRDYSNLWERLTMCEDCHRKAEKPPASERGDAASQEPV
jgi:hypothetical protein